MNLLCVCKHLRSSPNRAQSIQPLLATLIVRTRASLPAQVCPLGLVRLERSETAEILDVIASRLYIRVPQVSYEHSAPVNKPPIARRIADQPPGYVSQGSVL